MIVLEISHSVCKIDVIVKEELQPHSTGHSFTAN